MRADTTGASLRAAPGSSDGIQSFEGSDHDQNDVLGRKGSLSKRMFQRAASVAHHAGFSLHVTHDRNRHEREVEEHDIDKRCATSISVWRELRRAAGFTSACVCFFVLGR